MKELQTATTNDEALTKLIGTIGQHKCSNDQILKPYKHIFPELWTTNGVLMRNDKVVIPAALRLVLTYGVNVVNGVNGLDGICVIIVVSVINGGSLLWREHTHTRAHRDDY